MAAVNAVGTLTFAANAADAETVTIAGQVYTWESGALDASGKVLVGASAAASAQNLYDAINGSGSPGVQYHASTPVNPEVRAKAVTATTVVVQAKLPGQVGNRIPTTEAAAQLSWGGAVLAGGSGDSAADIQNILDTMQMPSNVAQALRDLASDPASV